MLASVRDDGELGVEPSLEIGELEHLVIGEGAGQMQTMFPHKLLNPGGQGLMERLLVFGCLCDPQDIVVIVSIDMANVSRNDVVLVTSWTLEGEFAFDCHSKAIG